MAAILVIEMPENCYLCPCYYEDFDSCTVLFQKAKADNGRPSWCPLRVLPEKVDHLSQLPDDIKKWTFITYETYGYEEGWNACLDEITGEKNV